MTVVVRAKVEERRCCSNWLLDSRGEDGGRGLIGLGVVDVLRDSSAIEMR